LVKDKKI